MIHEDFIRQTVKSSHAAKEPQDNMLSGVRSARPHDPLHLVERVRHHARQLLPGAQ